MAGIEASKNIPYPNVLFGLGIKHVGSTVAKVLCKNFNTIDKLATATYDDLIAIDDIGPKVAESVMKYFNDEENKNLIARLKNTGLQLESDEEVKDSDKLVAYLL